MKPILASRLISALSNPKRGLAGYMGGSVAESMTRQLQVELVESQKFVISNSLVNHAMQASFSNPSVILDMLQNSKPAFDNLWIEWDENYRQNVIQEIVKVKKDLGMDLEVYEFPEKVGYHIKLLTDEVGDKYFMYTAYSQYTNDPESIPSKKGQFISAPMSMILYNNDYPSFDDLKAKNDLLNEVPTDWVVPNEESMFLENFKNTFTLLANWYSMKHLPKSLVKNKDKFVLDLKMIKRIMKYNKSYEFNCFKEIAKNITLGQSASMHWLIPKEAFLAGYERQEMDFFIKQSLDALTGDARFLISLFGLINAQITTTQEVKPDSSVIHTQFGKRVPRNEYKLLNVDISANKVRSIYKSKYTGIKQREHKRRGHIRRLKNGKTTWVKSCIAGDPTLGSIVKDYNFTMGDKDE